MIVRRKETRGLVQNLQMKQIQHSSLCSDLEHEFICVHDFTEHIGSSTGAFYGVFVGHGGFDAASFTKKNIMKLLMEDKHFPTSTKKATRSAFVKTDHAFADASSLDRSSGTTALTAFILDKTMLIANTGNSRAMLGKRGRAIELLKDHKRNCTSERLCIEKLGGVIYDGYLNGQLFVARALGGWHIKGDCTDRGRRVSYNGL